MLKEGNTMHCEENYCIYNKDETCTLNEIYINLGGMCDDCLLVNIDHKQLEELKQAHLDTM